MTRTNNARDINKVRTALFDLLDDLHGGKSVDIDKSKLIVSACDSIIETAKVEVAYLRAIDSKDKSAFLEPPRLTHDGKK